MTTLFYSSLWVFFMKDTKEVNKEVKVVKEVKEDKDFRYLVRIANTDLDGNKAVSDALRGVKGISFMISNAICTVSGINKHQRIGTLKDEEIKKIDDVLKNPASYKIPAWLFNRKRDPEDGQDKHMFGVDLEVARDGDVQFMKKIRSYKGVRHMMGLPVRGQRTKSKFRKKKGKVLGVQRRKDAKSGR